MHGCKLCGVGWRIKSFCGPSVFDRASRRPYPGAISRPASIDAGYRLPAAPARQACGQWVKWVTPSKVEGVRSNRMRTRPMGQMGHDPRLSIARSGKRAKKRQERARGRGYGSSGLYGYPTFSRANVLRALPALRHISTTVRIYSIFNYLDNIFKSMTHKTHSEGNTLRVEHPRQ